MFCDLFSILTNRDISNGDRYSSKTEKILNTELI